MAVAIDWSRSVTISLLKTTMKVLSIKSIGISVAGVVFESVPREN